MSQSQADRGLAEPERGGEQRIEAQAGRFPYRGGLRQWRDCDWLQGPMVATLFRSLQRVAGARVTSPPDSYLIAHFMAQRYRLFLLFRLSSASEVRARLLSVLQGPQATTTTSIAMY